VAEDFRFSKHPTHQRLYVFTWFYHFPQKGCAFVCMHALLLSYLFFREWEGGMKEKAQWAITTVVEMPPSFLHAGLKMKL